jgi:hypothetical protein
MSPNFLTARIINRPLDALNLFRLRGNSVMKDQILKQRIAVTKKAATVRLFWGRRYTSVNLVE